MFELGEYKFFKSVTDQMQSSPIRFGGEGLWQGDW